jgi:hypothetical protein
MNVDLYFIVKEKKRIYFDQALEETDPKVIEYKQNKNKER